MSARVVSGRQLLEAMMGGASPESGNEEWRPKSLRSARVAHLREVLVRSQRVWSVGDLVTPTRDAGVNAVYVGEPHVILEVLPEDSPHARDGRYLIATVAADGDVVTCWIDGWRLEDYTGEGSE